MSYRTSFILKKIWFPWLLLGVTTYVSLTTDLIDLRFVVGTYSIVLMYAVLCVGWYKFEEATHLNRLSTDSALDAAEMLWVVLANVSGGDWSKQSPDWQTAAGRWRDNYYAVFTAHSERKRSLHATKVT